MVKSSPKQNLGRWGEEVAARYLEERGYRLIARNYRTPYGEIDLIFEQDATVVFVEVKTRSGLGYGQPEEAVTKKKRDHLTAAIAHYWQNNAEAERDWRVDVVAILRSWDGKLEEVEHFENAFN